MPKTSLLIFVCSFYACKHVNAQKEIFLQIDPACMDRFEYHINGQDTKGVEYITYRYKVNSEKTYYFEVGSESSNSSLSLPQGLKNCKNLNIDDVLVEKIRSGKTQLNIVRKDELGYNVSPVHLVSQIKDNGQQVSINSFDFQANVNLKDDNFQKNIAPETNPYEVYYTGYDIVNGMTQHYFHKTSKEVCQPNVDFTYIPELGIVNEHTMVSNLNPNESVLNLVRVNEVSFETYTASLAQKTTPAALSDAFAIPAGDITPEILADPIAETVTETIVVAEEVTPVAYEAPISTPKKEKKVVAKPVVVEKTLVTVPAAMPAKCAELAKENETIVQPGETLYGIARKNGVTVDQLRAWNNINADQGISICQHLVTVYKPELKPDSKHLKEELVSKEATEIKVPAIKEAHAWKDNHSGHHIVQKGETISSLSRKYGFSEQRFRLMNDLSDDDIIKIGQELKMSDCVCDVSKMSKPNDKKAAAPKEYSAPISASTETFIEKGIPTPAKSTQEKKMPSASITAVLPNKTNVSGSTYMRKTVHVVKEDENMDIIAKKYNISLSKLREINNLDRNEVLIPTQVIYVD
jgi:LysM repeat protein